jgi:hypothetical protein
MGGCPVTGYALFRNDPDQADPANGVEVWVEINSVSDTNIRDQPDLFEATATNFAPTDTGKTFKYVLEAFNIVGSSRGTIASYVLATIPSAPPSAPTIVDSMTSSTQITVSLTPLTSTSATGGTTLTGYALAQSDNVQDEAVSWVEVVGQTTGDSLALQHTVYGVVKG